MYIITIIMEMMLLKEKTRVLSSGKRLESYTPCVINSPFELVNIADFICIENKTLNKKAK